MFKILSAVLIIVFAVIHVGTANAMPIDGNASVIVVGNADDGKLRNSADVKSIILAVDCCDEEIIDKQSNASNCYIAHCHIDCGLVDQQLTNRTFLQMRNVDFAFGNFTIENVPEIPLRPPIA